MAATAVSILESTKAADSASSTTAASTWVFIKSHIACVSSNYVLTAVNAVVISLFDNKSF